jgi:DnaJ homologue, subfamily C, member 28, conserved domain
MTHWYESRIDRQIREAQERGEFDNLPGAGEPIPDRGELHDENWWLKQWIQRENITGLVPQTLKIRKEAEELDDRLAGETQESSVRRIVADLNARIVRANRGLVDGPPVVISLFNVDDVVARWREARA